MNITVSDFEKKTGISRDTVYSWIYRKNMPKGITLAGIGKTKILNVTKSYEHFDKVSK
jgi:predicted DNA-binding transcriptional regulator AlpA